MSEWYESPAVWISAGILLIAVARIAFGIGGWATGVDKDSKRFDKFIDKIEGKLDHISEQISDLFRRLPSPVAEGKSPLQLNKLGQSISDTLGAKQWAGEIAKGLKERVINKPPYDVQEFSFNYVRGEFKPTDEQESELGQCAYEHGIEKNIALDVLALELRDKLLELLRRVE